MASVGTASSLMIEEARAAPQAVARLLQANASVCRELGARLRRLEPAFAVTCARGSSDNAATFAKYLFEIRLGTVTASVGPSIRSVYGAAPRMRGALFLAVSQSGRSPDLLQLAAAAGESGALTVAIVNDVASPLAKACDVTLPVHAGPERSVAATKSFICSLAAILQLAACWAEDAELLSALEELPQALESAAACDWSAAERPLAEAAGLFVVGRGAGLAVAQEAALKLKETCGIHAEALSAAEMMHGPQTLAGPGFPVFVLGQPDESLLGVSALISRLVARGVPVLAAGPPAGMDCLALPCDPRLGAFVTPLALIQSLYPLIERVAQLRGRDPDAPPHLTKVTETL